jgi:hypothetical protein
MRLIISSLIASTILLWTTKADTSLAVEEATSSTTRVALFAQLQAPVDLQQQNNFNHETRHRLLQDVSAQCTDEAAVAQSCLKSSVSDGNSAACLTCIQGALAAAVKDFQSNVQSGVTIDCNTLESLICSPLESTCTCMSSCASVVESFFECELRAGFAAGNITNYDNCDFTCNATGGGGGEGGGGGGGGTSGGGTRIVSYAATGLAAVLGWTLTFLR